MAGATSCRNIAPGRHAAGAYEAPNARDSEGGSVADEPLLRGCRADWGTSKGLRSALIVYRPTGWGGKGAHTRSRDCIRAGTRPTPTGSERRPELH